MTSPHPALSERTPAIQKWEDRSEYFLNLRMYPVQDGPRRCVQRWTVLCRSGPARYEQSCSDLLRFEGIARLGDVLRFECIENSRKTWEIIQGETTKISRLDMMQRVENHTPCRNRHTGDRLKFQPVPFRDLLVKDQGGNSHFG